MKSQKTRAIGGWTLFTAIVSIIMFTIVRDKYPDMSVGVSVTVYTVIGFIALFSIIQLIRAEGQEKREKRKIKNI